ncbi:MAG: Arc family DNA-binding protein [Mesorhizobium sp.]|nr:MAG: Arc family DNA-binding protein [Mesorhizobium sp.]TIO42661.1 MAG: Arc family DNA-binding protein [Mesorhizobium sp.]
MTDPQFKIRLPSDAKAFIEAEAKANASSQTSEVVRAIRERMKAETRRTQRLEPKGNKFSL